MQTPRTADDFTPRLNFPQNFLYFSNCEPGSAVSFKAKISMYNLKPDGSRDYLSVGETELDAVYWVGGNAGCAARVATACRDATQPQQSVVSTSSN